MILDINKNGSVGLDDLAALGLSRETRTPLVRLLALAAAQSKTKVDDNVIIELAHDLSVAKEVVETKDSVSIADYVEEAWAAVQGIALQFNEDDPRFSTVQATSAAIDPVITSIVADLRDEQPGIQPEKHASVAVGLILTLLGLII